MNSRSKGKRGELEFIHQHLSQFWPEAKRNLDQFKGDGRDCLEAGDFHWQIKRTENLRLWDAIEQAETERRPTHVPLVAFRRNRSGWYVIAPAEFLVPLLAGKDPHAA